jgi:sugar lactone lactonase YvrE
MLKTATLLLIATVVVPIYGHVQSGSISSNEGIQSGPPLPYQVVRDWPQLPEGWNFGEVAGVDVDEADNVWVYSRGPHPVIQFDKSGKFLRSWPEPPTRRAHGIRVGDDGNIWTVDVDAHRIIKWTPDGRVLMVLGLASGSAGDENSQYAFNLPANLTFAPNGDFFVADGYGNSRIVKFNKDGEFLTKWGKKGTGDGEFDLVHDVALDAQGRLYVADRNNRRVQIFDQSGKFIGKWTDLGQVEGLYYVKSENALYMCDGGSGKDNEIHRIIKVSLEGKVLGVLSEFGKTPGKLHVPHYLAVDSTGAIYVAEVRNWRVQKFVKK